MTVTGRLRPTTPLGERASALVDAVLGARVHVDVLVPRTQVAARMRLVSRAEAAAIHADARASFAKRGIDVDRAIAGVGVMNEWNCEIAVMHLAVAVRDPDDVARPLASLEEWRGCDDDQISTLWQEYQDLQERLDPLRELGALTEQEFAAITAASKKKEADLLMSYGSRKLAAFVISTAAPPPS